MGYSIASIDIAQNNYLDEFFNANISIFQLSAIFSISNLDTLCDESSILEDERCIMLHPYICSFGVPIDEMITTQNTQRCKSCDEGYTLENERCVQDCTVNDFVIKLQETTPNVNGCNASSIDNVDISDLHTRGIRLSQLRLLTSDLATFITAGLGLTD